MEQHTDQGQKFAVLLLASSILIAGLLVGGAIVTRGSASGDIGSYQQPQQQTVEQPRTAEGQASPCGI